MNYKVSIGYVNEPWNYYKKANLGKIVELVEMGYYNRLGSIINKTLCKQFQQHHKAKEILSFTPYGTFSYRRDNDIVNITGIICLDFDPINNKSSKEAIKEKNKVWKLAEDFFGDSIVLMWDSIRKGLKIFPLTNIDANCPNGFKQAYLRVFDKFNDQIKLQGLNKYHKLDASSAKISQAQFLTGNARVKYNTDAIPYEVDLNGINLYKEAIPNELVSNEETLIEIEDLTKISDVKTEADEVSATPSIYKDEGYCEFVVEEMLLHFEDHPNDLIIGDGEYDNNMHLALVMLNLFPEQKAKDYTQRFFKLKNIYIPNKFNQNWNEIVKINNKDQFRFDVRKLLKLAYEWGMPKTHNDAYSLERAQKVYDRHKEKYELEYDYEVNENLGEIENELIEEIQNNKYTYIIGEPGIGKSTLAENISIKRGHRSVINNPTTVLAEKFKSNLGIKAIYGEKTSKQDFKGIDKELFVSTVYNSLPKLTRKNNPDQKIVFCDESHNPVSEFPYRSDGIIETFEAMNKYKNVVFMTGTPLKDEIMNIIPEYRSAKLIRVKSKVKKDKHVEVVVTNDPMQSAHNDSKVDIKNGKKTIVFINHKDRNIKFSNKYGDDVTTLVFNKETKHSREVLDLLKDEILKHDVLIGTIIFIEGINLNNSLDDINRIHIVNMQDPFRVEQLVSRLREGMRNVTIRLHLKDTHVFDYNIKDITSIEHQVTDRLKKKCSYATEYLKVYSNLNNGQKASNNDVVDYIYSISDTHNLRKEQIEDYKKEIKATYQLSKDGKEVTVTELGIASKVKTIDDVYTKRNPYLYVKELNRLGIRITKVEGGRVKKDKIDNVTIWKEVISQLVEPIYHHEKSSVKALKSIYKDFGDKNLIIEEGYTTDETKIKYLYVFHSRITKLTSLGFSIRKAFEVVLRSEYSNTKFENGIINPIIVNEYRNGSDKHYDDIACKLDNSINIKKGKYYIDELRKICTIATGKVVTNPTATIKKYYEYESKDSKGNPLRDSDGERNAYINILGYKEPKVMPDIPLEKEDLENIFAEIEKDFNSVIGSLN